MAVDAYSGKIDEKISLATENCTSRPLFSVYESTDAVLVSVDLPGVRREDVTYDLMLFGDAGGRKVVRIAAVRNPDLPDHAVCHIEQRPLGRMEISIDLPKSTLFDGGATASMENGVYRLCLSAKSSRMAQGAQNGKGDDFTN